MILNEGEEAAVLTVEVTAPPYLICRNKDSINTTNCEISLRSFHPAVEMFCPDGSNIHQIASKWYSMNDQVLEPACNVSITEDNWNQYQYAVAIKATTDGKYDGDTSATFTLEAEFTDGSNTVVQPRKSIEV